MKGAGGRRRLCGRGVGGVAKWSANVCDGGAASLPGRS